MATTAMLYRGTHLLSKRIEEPEKASRPFDKDRDGMVVGEGSGALVIESAQHAKARGAPVLATLAAWARSFLDPNSDQFADALAANYEAAIKNASLNTQDIGLFNAHACLLYTSPSPRDQRGSRMPSSA